MKDTVKVQRNQNSKYIHIPKDIANKINIEKGDVLVIEVLEDNSLKIKKVEI